MSWFANNALLGGGVRVRVWVREQRKIKRRSKALHYAFVGNPGHLSLLQVRAMHKRRLLTLEIQLMS